MSIKGPTSNSRGHSNAFHTDLKARSLSVNYQNPEKRNLRRCLRCSKDHELAECPQFISDEIQARLDIVKRSKLLHVCLKSGHMRGWCESRIFCSSGSDRRHHRLLHNPFRLRDAITAQDPPSGQTKGDTGSTGRHPVQGSRNAISSKSKSDGTVRNHHRSSFKNCFTARCAS